MKYENYNAATKLVEQIEEKEKLLCDLNFENTSSVAYLVGRMYVINVPIDANQAHDEVLPFMKIAKEFRQKAIAIVEKEIKQLKNELEKL